MKKLYLLFALLPVWLFGQTTFYMNPKSLSFVLINQNVDEVHTSVATCDSATLKFYKTGQLGQWEIALLSGTGSTLVKVDSLGKAGFGTATPGAHVEIETADTRNTGGLLIDFNETGAYHAFEIDGEQTTGHGIYGAFDALTTGSAAYFYSNSADASTRDIVSIFNDNASATGARVLNIRQDAATTALRVDQNADGSGIYVDCESTTYPAVYAYGKLGVIGVQDLAGGYAGYFSRDLAETGSWPCVTITNNNDTNTQPSLFVRMAGNSNSTAYALKIAKNTTSAPADNIGVGIQFEVETSAANNEVLATIETIARDATAASEDGAILFKTMKAGAAATEDMRLDEGYLKGLQNIYDLSTGANPVSYSMVTDDYITIADNDNLSFGNGTTDSPFSISADVRMRDATSFQLANKVVSNEEWYIFNASSKIYFRTYDKSATAYIGRYYSAALTSYENKNINIICSYDGTRVLGAHRIYLNSKRVDDTNYSSGSYVAMENNTDPMIFGKGSAYSNGEFHRVLLWNLDLGNASYDNLRNSIASGAPVPYTYQEASNTAKYTSDFSGGEGGWTAMRGAVAGNIDAVGGQDDNLRYTVNNELGGHYAQKTPGIAIGKRYRTTLSYFIPSGQSNIDGIIVSTGAVTNPNRTTTDAWTEITFEETATSTYLYVYATDGGATSFQDSGGDDVVYIRGVTVTQIGCVGQWEPDGINRLQWSDKSGNELHGTVTGATVVNAQREVFIANTEASDADGARESAIWFGGTQSGGEMTTLAKIQASHDGASDDEKGKIIISVNDGNDTNAPSKTVTIDSDADVAITGDLTITGDDLFMTTNTTGYILRADGTNYNPVAFVQSSDLAGFLNNETGTGLSVFNTEPVFASIITIGTNTGTSGQINFIASDNDQWNIATNTSDQMVLTGADAIRTNTDLESDLGTSAVRFDEVWGRHYNFTSRIAPDHTFSGIAVADTAGDTFTIFQVGYPKSDGRYWPAQADAMSTTPAVVMAAAAIDSAVAGVFIHQGYVRDDTWDWTPGGVLYLSDTVAGGLTQTAPNDPDEVVQVVGYALTADIIYFDPSFDRVEIE